MQFTERKQQVEAVMVPAFLDQAIEDIVIRDLCPPDTIVHAKVGAAVTFGGLAALALCGQFGLGWTDFARALSHELHQHVGALPCATICGGLFAVLPVLLLRFLLCSRLQFRVLARDHRLKIAMWFGACGARLAALGHHEATVGHFGSWLGAALLATYLLVRIIEVKSSRGLYLGVRLNS